ncbi:MAG: hypothetical protein MZV70_46745 [Desulfobacterales bacterium]|nr:hypothetical protein [Desulfobacterales bacterium]
MVRLPHISNFTDVDPLQAVAGLRVHFLERPQDLRGFRAVILPGSKNTRHDLEWLQTSGWADAVRAHHRNGGHILGVCGGYQMLGARVHDPDGHEGRPGSTEGLGLLPVETVLQAPKTTTLTRFRWDGADGCGYEIHMGRTTRLGGTPWVRILERNGRAEADEDGCVSPDGRIVGTYLHGLFDAPAVTARWLAALGLDDCGVPALGDLPRATASTTGWPITWRRMSTSSASWRRRDCEERMLNTGCRIGARWLVDPFARLANRGVSGPTG